MDEKQKMKNARYAMNARMFLIIASVVLIVNAVSSTLLDGFRWFGIVNIIREYEEENAGREDEKPAVTEEVKNDAKVPETARVEETAEVQEAATSEEQQELDVEGLLKDMETLGISVMDLKIIGAACILMAALRILLGVILFRLSNRVDKAPTIMKMILGLTAIEAVFAGLMVYKQALFLGSLLYTILILVFLYLGAFRMRKMHQEDPERIFAVNISRQIRREPSKAAEPKRSIRDRAMMNTGEESEGSEEEQD